MPGTETPSCAPFGDLPQWYIRKLEQASPEQLEYWTANIFDANSLEELFEKN